MKILCLLASLVVATASLSRADVGVTTPAVGYQKLIARGGSDSRLSIPLVKRPVLTARITSVGASTLSLLVAAMEDGAFAPGANGSYYVQFATGDLAGLCFPVLGNTSGILSLATQDDHPLTSHPLGSIATGVNGDIVRVRPFWSVADVLGHDTGSLLIESVDSLPIGPYVAGDAILLPDVVSPGAEKKPAATLYYVSEYGWRTTTDPITDAASTRLPPGRPFIVRRRDPEPVGMLVLGDVPSEPFRLPIPAVGADQDIDVAVALAQPLQTTLAHSGLFSSVEGQGPITASASAFKAGDMLLEFAANRKGFALPPERRFHVVGTGWFEVASPADEHVVQPSKGYVLRLRGERTARYWLQLPAN